MSDSPSPLSPERLSDDEINELADQDEFAPDASPFSAILMAREIRALRASPSPDLKPLREAHEAWCQNAASKDARTYTNRLISAVTDILSTPTLQVVAEPWKPIETAPKDGTPVRLRCAPVDVDAVWGVCAWGDGESGWLDPEDELEWAGEFVAWKPASSPLHPGGSGMRAAYAAMLESRQGCFVCEYPLHSYEQIHHQDKVMCESCAMVNGVLPDPYADVMPRSACIVFVGAPNVEEAGEKNG